MDAPNITKMSAQVPLKNYILHPEGSWLLGRLFLDMIREQDGIQGVGGMTLGADPLVSAVTVVSHLEGYPLPGFIIRKAPKGCI